MNMKKLPMPICVATLLLASAFVVLVCRCRIAAGNKIRLAALPLVTLLHLGKASKLVLLSTFATFVSVINF